MNGDIRLYGTLVNHTVSNKIVYAKQVFDDSFGDEGAFLSDINTSVKSSIADETEARKSADNGLLNAIDTLNGSGTGSVDYRISQAIENLRRDILHGAPEAFDTLKEIADWIASDETGTRVLINRVSTNEQAILDLAEADERIQEIINTDKEDLNAFKITIRDEVESSILQAVNDSKNRELEIWTETSRIDGRVTTLTNCVSTSLDSNGNVKYTQALQSVIDTGINNNTAFNDIASRWGVVADNQLVLEWLASGFKSQAAQGGSFAAIYAQGQQANQDAIALAKTEVLTDVAGNYVSKSSLQSEVNKYVKEGFGISSFSEVALKSYVDGADATLTALYNALNTSLTNNVNSLSSSISSVNAHADANTAKLEALASWSGNTPTGYKYTSGLITTSNKDSAVAELFASGSSSTSKNNVMSLIRAEVQDETSSLTLTADKIYLNGHTLATYIQATEGTIGGFNIGSNYLKSTNDKIVLNSDGSGSFASGNISWATDGAITFTSSALSRLLDQMYSTFGVCIVKEGINFLTTAGGGKTGSIYIENATGIPGMMHLSGDAGVYIAPELNVEGSVWAGSGFYKEGSSDSYVLLGGGGHSQLKTINGNSLFGSGDITISGGGSSSTAWSDIIGKPTTLSGYGITDALSTSGGTVSDGDYNIAIEGQYLRFKYENIVAFSMHTENTGDGPEFYAGGDVTLNGTANIQGTLGCQLLSVEDSSPMMQLYDTNTQTAATMFYSNYELEFTKASNYVFDASVTATSFNNSSDIRKKDIQDEAVSLTVDEIANAPLFKFKWKEEKEDTGIHMGTSAQYWQEVTPEIIMVSKDEMKSLYMQYDILALSSAITLAKEVVALKAEIAELKSKLN